MASGVRAVRCPLSFPDHHVLSTLTLFDPEISGRNDNLQVNIVDNKTFK